MRTDSNYPISNEDIAEAFLTADRKLSKAYCEARILTVHGIWTSEAGRRKQRQRRQLHPGQKYVTLKLNALVNDAFDRDNFELFLGNNNQYFMIAFNNLDVIRDNFAAVQAVGDNFEAAVAAAPPAPPKPPPTQAPPP